MNSFEILSDPKTPEAIQARRDELAKGSDAGLMTMLFCPIPFVDMLAGLAVDAVEHVRNAPEIEGLRPVKGAFDIDWSVTQATATYVEKVKAQGRDLTVEEVRCLHEYARTEQALMNGAKSVVMGVLQGVGIRMGSVKV